MYSESWCNSSKSFSQEITGVVYKKHATKGHEMGSLNCIFWEPIYTLTLIWNCDERTSLTCGCIFSVLTSQVYWMFTSSIDWSRDLCFSSMHMIYELQCIEHSLLPDPCWNKSTPRDCKVSQAAYPMYISCTFKMRFFSFSIGGLNFRPQAIWKL